MCVMSFDSLNDLILYISFLGQIAVPHWTARPPPCRTWPEAAHVRLPRPRWEAANPPRWPQASLPLVRNFPLLKAIGTLISRLNPIRLIGDIPSIRKSSPNSTRGRNNVKTLLMVSQILISVSDWKSFFEVKKPQSTLHAIPFFTNFPAYSIVVLIAWIFRVGGLSKPSIITWFDFLIVKVLTGFWFMHEIGHVL